MLDDSKKTRVQLLDEVRELRERVDALESIVLEHKRTEEELCRESEFTRALLESIAEGVVACDEDGKLTLFNRTAREWHGMDALAIPPEQWAEYYDLYGPDGTTPLPMESIPLARAFEGEQVRSAAMSIVAGSCPPRSILANGSPIIDDGGRKLGAVVAMRDITELKQAEEALTKHRAQLEDMVDERTKELKNEITERKRAQERATRFSRVLEGSLNEIYIFDAETFNFVEVNRGARENLGYSMEELRALTPLDLKPEFTAESFTELVEPLRTGKQDLVQFSTLHRRKDGSLYPVDVYLQLMADGSPVFVAIILDITERKRVEEARFETLARFSGFAEASQYGMGMADLEGHIVYVNSTLVRMLGEKTADDCLGKHFPTAYYPPLMTRRLQEEVLPALMRDGNWHGELELQTVDGRSVPTDENYFVIRDEDGQPRYLADILTDITDRRHVEEALRQSEERARKQRSALVELTLREEPIEADLQRSLKRVCEILSKSISVARTSVWILSNGGAELRCLNLYEADKNAHSHGTTLNAHDIPKYFDAIKTESRIYAEDVQNDPRTDELTQVYLKPLGITSMLDAGIVIDGKLVGVVCSEHVGEMRQWHSDEESFVSTIATFIAQLLIESERKRIQEALQESEERFRAAFDSAQDCVLIWDKDYNYLYANQAAIDHVGTTPDKVIGKNIRDGLGHVPDFMHLWMSRVDKVFEAGERLRVQDEQMMQGRQYHTDSILSPIRDADGNVVSVCVVYRDVTELRQAEAQMAAALKEKEALLREIHHRVKNNMQVIVSLLRMHARRSRSDQMREVFEDCRDRVNAMALVHESLYQSESLARIDFDAYLQKLAQNLARVHGAGRRKVKLAVRAQGMFLDTDCSIAAGMLVSELVSNAFKHAFPEAQRGTITVAMRNLEEDEVELVVQDDGVGFPPEIDASNFTTIGLRLVSDTVNLQLGGTMETEREGGTRFTIRFKCPGD